MTAHATKIRDHFIRRYIDRLDAPSPQTRSRLAKARAAADDRTVLTQAEYDAAVRLAHKLSPNGTR